MAKNLKIKFKNTQLAKAVKLGGSKDKSSEQKAEAASEKEAEAAADKPMDKKVAPPATTESDAPEAPKVKARSKSMFSEEGEAQSTATPALEPQSEAKQETPPKEPAPQVEAQAEEVQAPKAEEKPAPKEEPTPAIQAKEKEQSEPTVESKQPATEAPTSQPAPQPPVAKKMEDSTPKHTIKPAAPRSSLPPKKPSHVVKPRVKPRSEVVPAQKPRSVVKPRSEYRTPEPKHKHRKTEEKLTALPAEMRKPRVKLGPTGRHINDLLPPKKPKVEEKPRVITTRAARNAAAAKADSSKEKQQPTFRRPDRPSGGQKNYRDVKPLRKNQGKDNSRFDSRDRRGLGDNENTRWRKRRGKQTAKANEALTVRPSSLKIRLPITVKDLANEMKLKASELITKLFLQGVIVTINDFLEDETTVQFLGSECKCEISIDTTEEERIRITQKSIREEISEASDDELIQRAPVVAFMGHVDHGKTSLIDKIRESNRASEEAGAITQHIGAFRCSTSVGELTVLDTPGHEAFSAMRARGADVTDIVVLVVAGDEGIRQQTMEAIQHAKAAGVEIVVAINKCDKAGFDPENVYRQLADNELLPEAWGGSVITVNCSAATGEGVDTLLEMLALQSEVLELASHAQTRARGTVLESEMHKGMGVIATVLVQNGTLRQGDALVFEKTWGRVKTMRNELGKDISEAPPSFPVEITGLGGMPSAGEEFIVVSSEKEARSISEVREEEHKQKALLAKKRPVSMENFLQQASEDEKKVLKVVLRADVQGSLEALKTALLKIESDKVTVDPIFVGVGEISESDAQLAAASKAVIIGFHTQVESHAESLIKELGVTVRNYEVIYHAINEVKAMMTGLLDQLAQEEDRGKALVQAIFKSSQIGKIAGCIVTEGSIVRGHNMRVMRGGKEIWRGPIGNLKRMKDDAKEVVKGLECGIVLNGFDSFEEDDILESYETVYIKQEL